jgi:nucleotide-binding universal stress UspA family protein
MKRIQRIRTAGLINFKKLLFNKNSTGKEVEMLYRKILVPLDGSEFSECALEDVKGIAKGCSVPLVELLSVVQPPRESMTYGYPESFREEDLEKVVSQAKEYLARIEKRMQQQGIETRSVVSKGNAAENIIDYAAKNSIDLIIMSTHGRSGPARWALGSVADRVIRYSNVPVLVVSPPGCKI